MSNNKRGDMNNSQAIQLKRSVVMVSNLERALSIYRDFLGFTENYRQTSETDTFSHLLFGIPSDISTDFITLDLREHERVLALVAVNDPELLPQDPRAGLVVQVISVEQAMDKAQTLGLKCLPIRHELAPENGPPRSESAFYDFDGNPIVIFDLKEAL